jgi:hypothetical protein
MISARHIFRGLKRGIYDGSDLNQGPNKLIYSWVPDCDVVWKGNPFTGRVEKIARPEGKVFVVIVSPNSTSKVDGIAGWVERWNWADEDKMKKEAPIGYQDRYDELIWTRQDNNNIAASGEKP